MKCSKKSLLEIFKFVVKKRIEIYQDSPLLLYNSDIELLNQFITQIDAKNQNLKEFYCYLIINITKIMELGGLNFNGQKRLLIDHYISIWVISIFGTISLFDNSDLIIKDFNDQDQINQVKESLKHNISLIETIFMQKLEDKIIDLYFDQIQIKIYQSKSYEFIQCVSSYDGKHLFVLDNDQFIKTLELASINSIYFWLIQNQNPFLILSEINDQLLLNHIPVDAADYYFHISNRQPYNLLYKRPQIHYF